MKKIALLGSTGSIGTQVLNVVDRYPNKFKIVSLSAGSNAELLSEQINKYKPIVATLQNAEKASKIKEIPSTTNFYYGENSILHAIIKEADIVFVAVMGYAGVKAVKYAIECKKTIALANKETLVSAGELIIPLAKEHGVKIIPVDSEHSAIWQCLDYNENKPFKNLIITASGGAFRDKNLNELEFVTASDALKHPNWQMGAKITVDSATMVNKAFEVIEAKYLFNCQLNQIKTVIHPESIIHSMVEFQDGSIIAQMGNPTMEIPIQLALTYPEKLYAGDTFLNLVGKSLTFKEIDNNKYPCFSLVLKAMEMGGVYRTAISSADEVAVQLFLENKIKYTQIKDILSYVLDNVKPKKLTFESIEQTDKIARELAIDYYRSIK